METLKELTQSVAENLEKTTKKSKVLARKDLMSIIKLCKKMRVDCLDKKPVAETVVEVETVAEPIEPVAEPIEPVEEVEQPIVKKKLVKKSKKSKANL